MSALLDTLGAQAQTQALRVSGTLSLTDADALPGFATLVLLSPDEPDFWPHFTQSPEWQDGAADPMDRWSARVIGALAQSVDGKALFPFGGPPHHPFYSYALRSGQAQASPVQFLADGTVGLFASYRGAIALSQALPAEHAAPAPPCTACGPQPCITACPVSALTPAGYDVPKCRTYINSPAGADCRTMGCAVRRACPVGAGKRLPAQSAWHMDRFR